MSFIGSTHARSGTILSFGLARFQAVLTPGDFKTIARNTGCAPKKERPLTPQVVFWLMACVGLHTESMTQGLLRAWDWVRAACPHLPATCVSEEAFCQARRKLPLRFWRALWDRLEDRYQDRFAGAMRWKDRFRVLAGDGSEVRLPKVPALASFFGCPKGGWSRSVRCSPASVRPSSSSPSVSASTPLCATWFPPSSATIYCCWTAAFFPYAAIWSIVRRKAHYLLRLSNQMAALPKRIRRLGPQEWQVRFRPSTDSRRRCPGLPGELACRLIRYQRRGFRPSWLLTSLMDDHLCSREELIDLYHRRWTVETIYREWKHSLDIQNLRSRTPRGILKEVYTHLMLSNLIRYTMTQAAEGTDQAPVDLSFLAALTLERKAIGRIGRMSSAEYAILSARFLAEIRAAKIRKRPGRSYPRLQDGKVKNKGHGKYQQPARIARKSA